MYQEHDIEETLTLCDCQNKQFSSYNIRTIQ